MPLSSSSGLGCAVVAAAVLVPILTSTVSRQFFPHNFAHELLRDRFRGEQIDEVCVAVARELAGFVWAIASAQAKLPQS